MKVELENLSPVRKRLAVEVGVEEVSAMVREVYVSLRDSAEIEGFRKGKAPENILRQKFGKRVIEDVTSRLVEKSYAAAIKEKGLRPVSTPDIEVKKVEEGSPLSYSAVVDVAPQIDAAGYMNIEVEKKPVTVAEAEILENLNLLRERHASYAATEKSAAQGDLLTIDFNAFLDSTPLDKWHAKDANIILGQGSIFPEFDETLKGAKAGDIREFKKPFSADYHDKRVGGREVVFRIAVKSVKEKTLPALDDEFAKALAFAALDELKKKMNEEIMKFKERDEKERQRRDYMEKLLEKNPFDVPDSLVERYYKRIMAGVLERVRQGVINPLDRDLMSEESVTRYRDMASRQAKGDILLDSIAEKENIAVEDEDIEKEALELARAGNRSPGDVRELLENENTRGYFIEGIRREKVLDFVLERKIIMP